MKISGQNDVKLLSSLFGEIDDKGLWPEFIKDLYTPAEIKALVDRWQVVQELKKGKTYRVIHKELGISTTTITRVAKGLGRPKSGYLKVYEKIRGKNND